MESKPTSFQSISQLYNTSKQGKPQQKKFLIKVQKKQETNPLLRSQRFQYTLVEDMVEDYEVNEKTSVLFLSLAYHLAYPLYIKARLEQVYKARRHSNKILLLLNDHEDGQNSHIQLQLECVKFEFTCIMCWSFDEAAKYLQTLKAYENKSLTLLEGKPQGSTHLEQAVEVLGSIRRINKNDARRLMMNYGSLKDIILCEDYGEFKDIEGIGQQKVDVLGACFKGKFDTSKKV